MKIDIKLDHEAIRQIEQAAQEAAKEALEAVQYDLVDSKTMPFDNGYMEGGGTYTTGIKVTGNTVVDVSESDEIHFCLSNDAPQARRLYYHPEYDFRQTEGASGKRGAGWLEPYISGEKKDFVQEEFEKAFKRRSGL